MITKYKQIIWKSLQSLKLFQHLYLMLSIQAAMFAQQFMNTQIGESQPGMLNPADSDMSDASKDRPGNYL